MHIFNHEAHGAVTSVRSVALLLVAAMVVALSSCNKDEPEPVGSHVERAVLVYSIGTNSMEYYLGEDISEMKTGLKAFHEREGSDADRYRWMVYICNFASNPRLVELVYTDGQVTEKLIAEYDGTTSSCTRDRMTEVLTRFLSYANASSCGLVLASHGMGWDDGSPADGSRSGAGKLWFGQDGYRPEAKMNINELAAAIPDNTFDYIWTDCCFMGNMETAYELRDECRYYVGCPTELMASGSPYNLVVEPMLKGTPEQAARILLNYYSTQTGIGASATIGVYDMTQIQPVMQAARALLLNRADVDTQGLQPYHRSARWPSYYDFMDYMKRQAEVQNRPDLYGNLEQAMDRFMVYKGATKYFMGLYIDPQKYSGVSVHVFTDDGSDRDEFYKTLSWYRDVYTH